jgi:hypothetical protein
MLFMENDFERYSIGSTTDGLKPDANGALNILIQHDRRRTHQIGCQRRRAASTVPCGSTDHRRQFSMGLIGCRQ